MLQVFDFARLRRSRDGALLHCPKVFLNSFRTESWTDKTNELGQISFDSLIHRYGRAARAAEGRGLAPGRLDYTGSLVFGDGLLFALTLELSSVYPVDWRSGGFGRVWLITTSVAPS
jgi:hypothetical protein